MNLLAAAGVLLLLIVASGGEGINTGAVSIAALALIAGYVAACVAWPWTSCARCQDGKLRSPTGRAWRDCPRCGGSGKKVRLGRRLWSGFGDLYDKGRH